MRSPGIYDDSLIFERKPFTWPGGKTLAVWIAPNVEVWSFDSASDAATAPNAVAGPDVINYGTRDYGVHVGLWRIAEILDAAGIRATVAINSDACRIYPKAVDEMKKRHWEFVAHGINNSSHLGMLSPSDERRSIKSCLDTVGQITGQKVSGWISPGQIETASTLNLLGELGVVWTGDWNSDDQPVALKTQTRQVFSLPYCQIVNDTNLYATFGFNAQEYYQSVVDQFDVLVADSARQPRVLGLPVHPYLVGQPQRIKFFERAIKHMKQSSQAWFATGSEIVEFYRGVRS